jgi:hypothetical protein
MFWLCASSFGRHLVNIMVVPQHMVRPVMLHPRQGCGLPWQSGKLVFLLCPRSRWSTFVWGGQCPLGPNTGCCGHPPCSWDLHPLYSLALSREEVSQASSLDSWYIPLLLPSWAVHHLAVLCTRSWWSGAIWLHSMIPQTAGHLPKKSKTNPARHSQLRILMSSGKVVPGSPLMPAVHIKTQCPTGLSRPIKRTPVLVLCASTVPWRPKPPLRLNRLTGSIHLRLWPVTH